MSIEIKTPARWNSDVDDDSMTTLILKDWNVIAPIAWEGFLCAGPGTVRIRVGNGECDFVYRLGAVSDRHAADVRTYNPKREVLVAVRHGFRHYSVYRISAQPSPPAIWAVTTGHLHGATAH